MRSDIIVLAYLEKEYLKYGYGHAISLKKVFEDLLKNTNLANECIKKSLDNLNNDGKIEYPLKSSKSYLPKYSKIQPNDGEELDFLALKEQSTH